MGKILSGINGERFPDLKTIQNYSIIFAEGVDISSVKEDEIIWQLFWAKDNQENEYTKVPTTTSKQKRGKTVTFQFYENLLNKNLQVQASYKEETVQLRITPKSDGTEKIIDVFFLDVEYKIREKDNLKYINNFNLQIFTLNMLGKKLDFKIYDIVNGEEKEVYKSPTSLEIIQKNGVVKAKQAIMLTPFMPINAQKDMSASEHRYKLKIWQTDNETNFYEEELKVKNEMGKMDVPQDSQVPQTTGTSEPVKKKEDEKKCFCEKEFSVDDIKSFYNYKSLFTAKNCPLHSNMKTYEEFTKALNKAMKDNDISTCLRKAHFLAQIEAETGFDTTLEYADGWDYDHSTHIDGYNKFKPYSNYKKDKKQSDAIHLKYTLQQIKKLEREYNRYNECISHGHNVKGYGPKYKGRGIIQLTWRDTYEAYFSKIKKPEFIETPNIVASDMTHVCNSAGWYWRERSTWGDLNKFADTDDLISVCVGVNGGLRGFTHRKLNLKKILTLMKVKENCKNQKIKNLGIYKYETSAIKNSNWGKKEKNKNEIQKYDD